VDNFITLTGEDKIKRFIRSLTDRERIELIEEVKKMIELKTSNLNKLEKDELRLIKYDLTEEYW
jgi:uncharacterized ubiquitin-like protein YukD